MGARPPFREVVYRLRPRGAAAPQLLPLVLASGQEGLVVETRAAHLDARGHVWRVLVVHGPSVTLSQAEARFRAFDPGFVLEKTLLGRTRHSLFLWYKYRIAAEGRRFSHTALAFRLLGRDTLVTDETRRGELTIRIVARGGPALQTFLRRARQSAEPAFDFDLLYTGPPRAAFAAALTPEEDAALTAAARLGYLDVPRRAGLQAVARALKISTSAAGYRLRRVQAKLARLYLGPSA